MACDHLAIARGIRIWTVQQSQTVVPLRETASSNPLPPMSRVAIQVVGGVGSAARPRCVIRSFDILAKSASYGVVILSSLDPRASATLKTDLDMVHVYRNVPKLGHVAVGRHAQKRMEEDNI